MASGDPTKMAMVNVESKLPPIQRLEKMAQNLTDMLPCLSVRTASNPFVCVCVCVNGICFYYIGLYCISNTYFTIFIGSHAVTSLVSNSIHSIKVLI